MKNKKRMYVMAVMAALFLNASIANACLVHAKISFKEEFKRSDVIFRGTLLGCFTENGESFVKYAVKDIWKGAKKREYTFLIKSECSIKGANSRIGTDVLNFSRFIKGTTHLEATTRYSICGFGRNTRLEPKWKGDRRSLWKRLTTKDNRHPDIIALGTPSHSFK